ncbi:assimilatory sulfite reductase (NADPH) flavoprotein subunit [Buchnera aphidicola (Muscaphis stroyani)]|uniref:Sulfite reductase [NADPH] flavoprotein alpha-component n=1 Tax=Buchnera aphidicola (Muscaphis stroyani) TaxID=1241869 RepID=A0A4D6Y480_9GAMM|nr:assimilatory sulfite reductase (NADPH) flavoprotein subunit [Buchnera aphidicola]QCI24476.1 assimilatory sulfite reductase (NADPH) flavoprotein subunit [Buchnera aphidicola (Muscaphis stroyani)]
MNNQNLYNNLLPLNTEQLKNLKKLEKTCSKIELAWLSGYFWKAANQKHTELISELNESKSNNIITILYASQTGNSKLLSQRLSRYLKDKEKNVNLVNISDYNFKKINEEKILILIISTQGEGEPPEEALSFYKFIMSKKAPKLNKLNYSVFGLGDVSYNFFCQSGKDFDKRFRDLGAKSLIDRVDADIEYEDIYKKWSYNLFTSINQINQWDSSSSFLERKNTLKKLPSVYTKMKPASAIVLNSQKITGRNSTKDIYHIEIDISTLKIQYHPGDAIGIWYKNDVNLVKKILKCLSIKKTDTIQIKKNTFNIFDALLKSYELTVNTKEIVRKYAIFTNNMYLKKIISNEKDLKKYVATTPLVNMIYDHPSPINPGKFVSILRPLTPRLYSISSSQAEENDEIHITVGLVKKMFSGVMHFGGASSYLSQFLKMDDKINIFIESNNNFRLPVDKDTPIIMIGSGTGIAPFRAFMQQRDNDGSRGKNWLFFGNPNFTEDFLYQLEWQKYLKKQLLTKIDLAWSKDQKNKIYVQDKMKEKSKEIWSWIQEGAQIYVCGNAAKMAKDVEKMLINIINQNSNMNLENSEEFLNELRENRRYQRDVY